MRKNNRLIVLIMSIVMLCSFSTCGLAHDNMKKELTEHQKAWIADIDGPLREGLEKAAGVTQKVKLGIPGMGRAKKIITEYYLGK